MPTTAAVTRSESPAAGSLPTASRSTTSSRPRACLADLGFNAGGLVQGHIYGILDPAQDYAIKTVTPNISSLVQVRGSEVTIWGVPGDPAHDKFRWYTKTAGK